MGERHRRRAKMRRVGDREIDFVLGGNRALERHAVRLGMGDRREHLFKLGELRLRCYGEAGDSDRWLELPADDLWLFPGTA